MVPMNQIEKVKVKDLLPNPFRNMDHYRIPEEKIEALIRSFKTSGVWPTVVARKAGNKIEKAFGHARTEAAKRLYGPNHEIEVVIMDLDDETMLRMMADENGELWGTDFLVDMETVEAVINAHVAGKIKLESDGRKLAVIHKLRADENYSALGVAKFLGWLKPNGEVQERVGVAVRGLELIKEGVLGIEEFEGLGKKGALALVKETGQIKPPEESKLTEPEAIEKRKALRVKVAKAVSTALKSGEVGYRNVRKITEKAVYDEDKGWLKTLPQAEQAIPKLCTNIRSFLCEHYDKERYQKVQDVIAAKKDLSPELVHEVWAALSVVSDTCQILMRQLKPSRTTKGANNMKSLPVK